MKKNPMDRRRFVTTVGQGSLAALLGLPSLRLWAQSSGHELPVNCSPPSHGAAKHITFDTSAPILPRKSVWDLSPAEVTRLENAYKAMRELATSKPQDPRGWMQQANVHCFNCSGGYDPSNLEIHGSWWFLPWHRCYLHVHERILAKLVGDPTFRLAYWDWDTYPTHAILPPTFGNPGPLSDAFRGAAATDVIPDDITGPAAIKVALAPHTARAFMGKTTAGTLEQSPHGPVHIWTGDANPSDPSKPPGCFWPDNAGGTPVDQPNNPQNPNGCLDMGVLATAAQDPVFFAHHSNIDRMWDRWLQLSGRQGNFTDPAWLNHQFNFYDENGDWIYITVADVIGQAEQSNLRYTYQAPQNESAPAEMTNANPSPSPSSTAKAKTAKSQATQQLTITSAEKPISVGTKPHVRTVDLPDAHREKLRALASGGAREWFLHIDGLTLPAGEGVILNVFVNEPNANPKTPIGPSFVGTFTSVPTGHQHGGHPLVRNALFELRPETAQLLTNEKKITVILVPKLVNGTEPAKSNLTYKKIYLTEEPSEPQKR